MIKFKFVEDNKSAIYSEKGNCLLTEDDYFGENELKYLVKSNNNYPEALELLKKLVEFGNQIPNNYGRTKNHYELLSKVNKFLKEQENGEK